ncbi:MAG: SHOCT domain-containing protein [Theionarchaea archaeon]|nr:SHOCT domain-containing protein [Theionarchaea archaeon]
MKKVIVTLFAVLLLLSNVNIITGADTVKILIDESRVHGWDELYQELLQEVGFDKDTDWTYSFENKEEGWGYSNVTKRLQNIGSVDVRKKGKLSYSTLRNYDVLVIGSFGESYSSAEAEAIKQFVDNGGGLLLLADGEYPNNSISRSFDVLFHSENVEIASKKGVSKRFRYLTMSLTTDKDYFFYVDDIKSHPVTKGIDEIAWLSGIPITSYESGKVLARTGDDTWADNAGLLAEGMGSQQDDEDSGPFDIILAVENVSKGRAVFIGSAESFWNVITENEDGNLDLLENAVDWLSEPGGPYKQYKTTNEQAQEKLSSATSLYNGHLFSQAKSAYEDAIGIFEESNEIYPNSEANQGIEEAQDYIQKCETGMDADEIFDEAEGLYDQREYEKAIEEYEKAKPLYQEIEYTERVQECETRIQESNDWIEIREDAQSLYQQGEDALASAPSTFDTAGYENAKSIFEQAKSTWQEYDEPSQVQACEEKISLCDDEIAKIEKNKMIVTIVVIVVIVVVILVVVVVIRKRKPKLVPEPALEVQPPTEEGIPSEGRTEALDALDDRYAKGEITKEEYEKLKSVLEKE